MSTVCVNLVPVARREARRRRARGRAWLAAGAVYLLCWLAAGTVARAGGSGGEQRLLREHALTQTRVDEASADATALGRELDRVMLELRAQRAVGRQPDWSLLLALLSGTLGDEVVLRSVDLEGRPPGFVLAFLGLAQSQADVSRFVLRLEEISLFESVKLVDARREPFLDGHAVRFGIECVLGAGGETLP